MQRFVCFRSSNFTNKLSFCTQMLTHRVPVQAELRYAEVDSQSFSTAIPRPSRFQASALFHLYPVSPTSVHGSTYPQRLNCVDPLTEDIGGLRTMRAIFAGGSTVASSEASFLGSTLPSRGVFLCQFLYLCGMLLCILLCV